MRELEAAETEAMRDFYASPPGEAHDVAGAACCLVPGVALQWVNRVAGLGLAGAVTDAELDAIGRIYEGLPHSVAVSEDAEPRDLAERLQERGYRPGYAWMKFRRGVEPLQTRPTNLGVRPASPDDGAAFARVVATAYGFPDALMEVCAGLPGRPGWHCFMACDGDRAVGAGALYVLGGYGWLGLAGTLSEARGRGAQSAILAARIEAARGAGVETLVTETGVREPGRPDNSYRNILRAGFQEAGARPNYVR